jgi:pyruvate formate lyase activating enzyme
MSTGQLQTRPKAQFAHLTSAAGLITDIKKFAIHDGPGIRTTVFFKGCPLRCQWCHNPETQGDTPVVAYYVANCIACGRCIEACPEQALSRGEDAIIIDRRACTDCGVCTEVCPAEAMVMHGRGVTVAEVIAEVEKDRPFYENSGGGITLSGGEPLYQPQFAAAVLQAAKQAGLHTCLDTCGYAPWSAFEAVLPHTDLILYDIKTMNDKLHRAYTGRCNAMVLRNIEALAEEDVAIEVRTPVVPGVNATVQDIVAIADFLKGLPRLFDLELLPYHELGGSKFERLGMTYPLAELKPPSSQLMAELTQAVRDRGVNCSVGN